MPGDLHNLINLRAARGHDGVQEVVDYLSSNILEPAITRYNSEVGPTLLGRLLAERVTQNPRQLVGYRGRLGLLIEYTIGVIIGELLRREFELYLSFVVNNQYPDFYVRDLAGTQLLRIDCKTLHDQSAEYSARFDYLTVDVQPLDDLLLYVAWQWDEERALDGNGTLTYPKILGGLIVPAIDIAEERDRDLLLRGGELAAARLAMIDLTHTCHGR